ncbi:glutathione S-transferase family protein [Pseudomonas abietaniphila]
MTNQSEFKVFPRERLEQEARAIRDGMADPARSMVVGDDPHPRFELFNAASSLCSQKVRAVLHEKGQSYRSNDMMILCTYGDDRVVAAEHYSAAYVRLRLAAGSELDRPMVSGYSGRTSVQSEGFDPCVVPMLIDYEAGRVIVDSMRICLYIDQMAESGETLMPENDLDRSKVLKQMAIVDTIPNGSLLYGFHPDRDLRPDVLKEVMSTVYDYKILALEAKISQHSDDAELVAAYRAKIVKESGGRNVCRNPDFQREARITVTKLLGDLDRVLENPDHGPWIAGDVFTLADLVWGVNLIRLSYLGLGDLWLTLPGVTRYFANLANRPSLQEEAIRSSLRSLPPSTQFGSLVAQLGISAS